MADLQTAKIKIAENPSGIAGVITLHENVVRTIAGLAARGVEGIHSSGKWRLVSFGDDPTRGAHSEVGNKQAAFDLDIVIESGSDIREVAKQLRLKTAAEVDTAAGREVVVINVNVVLPSSNNNKSQKRVLWCSEPFTNGPHEYDQEEPR